MADGPSIGLLIGAKPKGETEDLGDPSQAAAEAVMAAVKDNDVGALAEALRLCFDAYSMSGEGEDEYEVILPEAPKPGVLPITATVTAGNEADLLAGELDIHEEAHAEDAVKAHSWTKYVGWASGGVAALALLLWGMRRVIGARSVRVGGAA